MTNLHKQLAQAMIGFPHSFSEQPYSSEYPRYNIIKDGDNYILEIAALGLAKEDIKVMLKNGELTINALKQEPYKDSGDYLTKGLSSKGWNRVFSISKGVSVSEVTLDKGILTIYINKEPEEEYLLEIKGT